MAREITASVRAGESLETVAERILDLDDPVVEVPRYVRELRSASRLALSRGDRNILKQTVDRYATRIGSLGEQHPDGSRRPSSDTIRAATEQLVEDLKKAKADQVDHIVDRWVIARARAQARQVARDQVVGTYRDAYVEATRTKPWTAGYRWTLSGRHPKGDECDVFAGRDEFGLGPGGYPSDKLPLHPHSRCLCSQTQIVDARYLERQRAREAGEPEPPRPWESGERVPAEDWLRRQPRARQREILGPTRLRLFDEGRTVLRDGEPIPVYELLGQAPPVRAPAEVVQVKPVRAADLARREVVPPPRLVARTARAKRPETSVEEARRRSQARVEADRRRAERAAERARKAEARRAKAEQAKAERERKAWLEAERRRRAADETARLEREALEARQRSEVARPRVPLREVSLDFEPAAVRLEGAEGNDIRGVAYRGMRAGQVVRRPGAGWQARIGEKSLGAFRTPDEAARAIGQKRAEIERAVLSRPRPDTARVELARRKRDLDAAGVPDTPGAFSTREHASGWLRAVANVELDGEASLAELNLATRQVALLPPEAVAQIRSHGVRGLLSTRRAGEAIPELRGKKTFDGRPWEAVDGVYRDRARQWHARTGRATVDDARASGHRSNVITHEIGHAIDFAMHQASRSGEFMLALSEDAGAGRRALASVGGDYISAPTEAGIRESFAEAFSMWAANAGEPGAAARNAPGLAPRVSEFFDRLFERARRGPGLAGDEALLESPPNVTLTNWVSDPTHVRGTERPIELWLTAEDQVEIRKLIAELPDEP